MDRNCCSLPKINLRDHRVTDMKRILKDLKQIGSTPVSVLLSNNSRNRLPKVSVTEESRSNSISDSESNAKKDSRTGSGGSLKDMNSNEESENCSSISKTRDTRGSHKVALPGPRCLTRNRAIIKVHSVGGIEKNSHRELPSIERDAMAQDNQQPKVSASCWAVADAATGQVIYGSREHHRREVASITKVMTCYVVCRLIREYKINAKSTFIQVSNTAACMGGTSARLQSGDVLTVWDLMHGLMLPSGNDAAMCLAESFGTFIYMQSDEYKQKLKRNPEFANFTKNRNGLRYFLNAMNKTAEELELLETRYDNPHGLMCPTNRSTAADIAKLSSKAMKFDEFREIVNRRTYRCVIEQVDQTERCVVWENTNKLLDEGWEGIKTGITTAAGPCFTGFTRIEGQQYIVVVLGCETVNTRWVDCRLLAKWAHKNKCKF